MHQVDEDILERALPRLQVGEGDAELAEPNTTKYSDVVSTGVTTLCSNVRMKRAISKR